MGKTSSVAFAFSREGWIIPTTTGTISALSSILVMTTIFRSRDTRTSAYHCILFAISFGDVISSIAIALTTIPMPTDVNDFYEFDGKSYGNEATCEAQSFAIVLGSLLSLFFDAILSVFYVYTIRFGMREETFKKKILPPALVFSMAVSIGVTINTLSSGVLNPRPFEPYCFIGPYPVHCERNESNKVHACERGGMELSKTVFIAVLLPTLLIAVGFIIVVCSMCLVVKTVFGIDISNKKSKSQEIGDHESIEAINEEHSRVSSELDLTETKVIVCQALMYIGAFILTRIPQLILVVSNGNGSETFYSIVGPLKAIFHPLQGFFNALIFLGHKAHSLRRIRTNLTFFQCLWKVIESPSEVPEVVIESIQLVESEAIQAREGGDPALSFDLTSKDTPSVHLSNVLSDSSKVLSDSSKVLSELESSKTHDDSEDAKDNKGPYRYYANPN